MQWLDEQNRACVVCGKPVPFDEECYYIRTGALSEEDDDFVPDHDTGFVHKDCLVWQKLADYS